MQREKGLLGDTRTCTPNSRLCSPQTPSLEAQPAGGPCWRNRHLRSTQWQKAGQLGHNPGQTAHSVLEPGLGKMVEGHSEGSMFSTPGGSRDAPWHLGWASHHPGEGP